MGDDQWRSDQTGCSAILYQISNISYKIPLMTAFEMTLSSRWTYPTAGYPASRYEPPWFMVSTAKRGGAPGTSQTHIRALVIPAHPVISSLWPFTRAGNAHLRASSRQYSLTSSDHHVTRAVFAAAAAIRRSVRRRNQRLLTRSRKSVPRCRTGRR